MEKPYYLLSPIRVALISASWKGKDNFMPASWCFPLSFEPQLFGVAVAPKRFTHGLIKGSREYVINLPGEGLKGAVEKHGRVSGRDCDKFAVAGLTREKSGKVSAPSIRECLASIECRVVQELETGDHTVFVGEVLDVKVRGSGRGLYQKDGALVEI